MYVNGAVGAAAWRDADGVTLIELLIAIMLLGVIGATLTMAMTVGMTTIADTKERFASTNRQSFANRFVVPDIEANDISRNPTFTGGTDGTALIQNTISPADASGTTCTTTPIPLFSVVSIDPASPSTPKLTVYKVALGPDGCTLYRGPSAKTPITADDVAVLGGLRTAGPAAVTISPANSAFERPTVQLQLGDDAAGACTGPKPAECPFDIMVTASSRVGR